jgi:hypothetical protein
MWGLPVELVGLFKRETKLLSLDKYSSTKAVVVIL